LDLLRLLAEKPWIGLGPHNRWDRSPRIDMELATDRLEPPIIPHMAMESDDLQSNYMDNDLR
jgi:hypothetical protein